MSQEIPKTSKQWNVAVQDGSKGFDALEFSEQPVSPPGDNEVLVKLEAASLNYRDLMIPMGQYGLPSKDNVIPGSDGAGTVISVGRNVTRFKIGDKVITLFNQSHIGGPLTGADMATGLGGAMDGTLRTVGCFNENGLVRMPSNLTPGEAASLTCAGNTAWNALFGTADHKLTAGQWVLTEGTGGVSIFALQFAKAVGARVVATTSSAEKAKLLEKLGADHIINYKETPDWGVKAKELTGGGGVDHVVEVAGPASIAQSFEAIKIGGIINIIGFVAGDAENQPGFLECLMRQCTVRGILVGSRTLMEQMCQAIEANPEKLRPIVDSKTFTLEQTKEAYEYQWSGKHQGNVVVNIA